MKKFKIVFSYILDTTVRKPKFVELATSVWSAIKIVNERILKPLVYNPKNFTAITPTSFFTPYLDPPVAVGQHHDRDILNTDNRFDLSLSLQFWEKWLKTSTNLKAGQLVIMGWLEHISKRGRYKLGKIEEIILQNRNGKPTVR